MSVLAESPSPARIAPAPRRRRRGRRIAIGVAVFVALVAAVVAGLFLLVNETTKDAQEVSDRFLAAVQRGDGAAAYAVTSPAFRQVASKAQLAGLVERIAPALGTGEPTVTGKRIQVSTGTGKVAVFAYRLDATDGKDLYFRTVVSTEEDGWAVMNFRSSRTALPADVE